MRVGSKVKKTKGYKFPGIVVSIFKNTKGEERIVAEAIGEYQGMLHIFSPEQLEEIINNHK